MDNVVRVARPNAIPDKYGCPAAGAACVVVQYGFFPEGLPPVPSGPLRSVGGLLRREMMLLRNDNIVTTGLEVFLQRPPVGRVSGADPEAVLA